jgi:hypothetical protein
MDVGIPPNLPLGCLLHRSELTSSGTILASPVRSNEQELMVQPIVSGALAGMAATMTMAMRRLYSVLDSREGYPLPSR